MISLDTLNYAFHSIKVADAAGDILAIGSSGEILAAQSGTWNIGTVATITNAVTIQDGGNTITVDGTVGISGTVAVSATDLDIRNLTSASDNVEIKTAAGVALAIDGSGFITANINGSVAVTQSTSPWVVSGAVSTTPTAFDTWQVSKVSASDSELEIASTPLADRLRIVITNLGNQRVYLAPATGVDVDDFPLGAGASLEWDAQEDMNIFCICASGQTADLRVAEFSA